MLTNLSPRIICSALLIAVDRSIARRISQLQSAKHSYINHRYSHADFGFLPNRCADARSGGPRPPPGQLSGLSMAFGRAAAEGKSGSNQLPGTRGMYRSLEKFGAIGGELADSSSIAGGQQTERHSYTDIGSPQPLTRSRE